MAGVSAAYLMTAFRIFRACDVRSASGTSAYQRPSPTIDTNGWHISQQVDGMSCGQK